MVRSRLTISMLLTNKVHGVVGQQHRNGQPLMDPPHPGLRGQAAASFLEEEETDAEQGDGSRQGDVVGGVAEAGPMAAIGAHQEQRVVEKNLLQKARPGGPEKSLFVQVESRLQQGHRQEQAQQGKQQQRHRQAEKRVIDALSSCGNTDGCGDTDVDKHLVQQLSGAHIDRRASASTPSPSTELGSSSTPPALPLAPDESTAGPPALPQEVVDACNGPSESARQLFGRSVEGGKNVEHGVEAFSPTLQKHNAAGDGRVCIGGASDDFVEAEFEIPGDAGEVHQLTLVHVGGPKSGISCSMWPKSGCNYDMWGSRHDTLSPWVIKMPGVAGEETAKGDPVLPVQASYEDIKRDFKHIIINGHNESYRYLPVGSREELPGNNGGSAGMYEIWAVGGANSTALTFRNTVAPGNGFPALAPGKYKIVVGENYFKGLGHYKDTDNFGVTCMRVFACVAGGDANPALAVT